MSLNDQPTRPMAKGPLIAATLGAQGRRRVLDRYSSSAMLPRNEAFFERAIAEFRR